MKTLSSTLRAAQRSASSSPYVEALLADYWGYGLRARPQRVYTGAEQAGDPVAAALAPDGSLLRLRRYTQATTLRLQVGASADDAFENSTTPVITIDEVLADDSDEYVGWRWQGVTVPQGATILRASLSMVFSSSADGDPLGTLYGDDADNAAAFTTGASDLSGRTPTTATVSIDKTGVLSDDSTFVELADVTAIVQEIVNRGGWSSGNALALLYQASATGSRDFSVWQYDEDPYYGAKLVITYATGSPPATAYVSRVASPGAGSTFSSWSSLDAEISAVGGVALAVDSDTCYAFMVDDDLTTIVMRTSTDHGATWSSRSTVYSGGGTKFALAAAAADDDDIVLFYAEVGGAVYATRWGGSSWSTPAAWSNSLVSVTGLAAEYLLDWQVVVTGADASQVHGVWACRYGDGVEQTVDTWGSLREVASAAAGADVSFAAPSVLVSDVHRVWFVESYAGDEPYDRQQWSTMGLLHDFNEEQWREPAGFDYESAAGVAAAGDATVLWLVASDGVWLCDLPAFSELDVSADVVLARVRTDAEGAVVELELDNADGAYTAYGSGALASLARGSRLQLTPGYRTSAGAETPSTPYSYWVESVELVTGARPRLRLRARDGWSLLATWRARRQFAWAAGDKTVSQLLLFLAARAGVEYTVESASDALTAQQPAFTVHAGESGLVAVRRLLSLVEDVAYWSGDELTTVHTATDDSSTYDLGDGHAILEAVYRDLGPAINRARVVGFPGVYGDESDFGEVELVERVGTVVDVNLTDGEDATDRAVAELRRAHIQARRDDITLFGVHCALEIYDVVAVTDSRVGLDAIPCRVLGYSWYYNPGRARYEMSLTLGNV